MFEWSEAPRNALNGAFILDLFRELPFNDPKGWTYNYYLQYPALTILFYPPLFYFFLAMAYAVFSTSHSVAVGIVIFFLALWAWGVFELGKLIAGYWSGIFSAILLFLTPVVIKWSQQVMLEIPMLALATWSLVFVLKYTEDKRLLFMLAAALMAIAALYTKQTAIVPITSIIFGGSGVLFHGGQHLQY